MSTLLEVLGLENREHSPHEIDQAYRNRTAAALGLLPSDSEPLYAVSDAYQVLRNPSHRAKYVELGDKRFFDQYHDIKYIDAVDILLGSFGVDRLSYLIPDIPALSILVGCHKEMKGIIKGPLDISSTSLSVMRRPGWREGRAKITDQLKNTKGDYSRAKVMPQLREIQHLIEDYQGEKGSAIVGDRIIEAFKDTTMGLDWMHVIAAVFYTRGTNHYNKCRKLINNRKDIECPITKVMAYTRKCLKKTQNFWKETNRPYDDLINMFFLACAFSLMIEASRALNKTIGYVFDAQKQQIPKRKDRTVPAKALADIGDWMSKREEVFITYDDVLTSAITHTAYHTVYVVTKMGDIPPVTYSFPDSEFPDRHKTLTKIALDIRQAENLSEEEFFYDIMLSQAAITNMNTTIMNNALITMSTQM